MDFFSILIGITLSLTGLVPFIHVNTLLEVAKYFTITNFQLFAVALTFARVPFEILSFTTFGFFNETTSIATSKATAICNSKVLLKQSALAAVFALLLFPASTYILPLIWKEIRSFAIVISLFIFTIVALKYARQNAFQTTAVILTASAAGAFTLNTISTSGLFPLLAGLFAIPALIKTKNSHFAHTKSEFDAKISAAGAVTVLFAGVLPAIGPVLIALLASELLAINAFSFQAFVFSIYSARVVFDFANVYNIGTARSMPATFIENSVSYEQILLLLLIGIACMLFATLITTKIANKIKKFNFSSGKAKIAILTLIIAATALQTGSFGLLTLVTSSVIGTYAYQVEKRVLLSASLITPALISILAL